jgi:hypothetical protein
VKRNKDMVASYRFTALQSKSINVNLTVSVGDTLYFHLNMGSTATGDQSTTFIGTPVQILLNTTRHLQCRNWKANCV